ncbi:MAG: VCBS repeat-containing protein, partial [Alphaproteobacteria bacterium]|nr:VCBS repeat-containing protein [Alphaproteobacteria bacterium]
MRTALLRATCGLAALGLAAVCWTVPAHAADPPRFAAEQKTGIAHRYEGGWEFFVGGGVAAFDCDADSRPDLAMAGGSAPAALFRNISQPGKALRFRPMVRAGIEMHGATGLYPLDVDADGNTDLILLRVGENILYRGLGDCRFERANRAWRFDGGGAWSTAFSARWDADNAFPTLAVGNYVDRARDGAPFGTCHGNRLYRPESGAPGFAAPTPLEPGYCALSMLFSDWSRSGRRDLRIANDRQYHIDEGAEQLWRIPPRGAPQAYSEADGWQTLRLFGMGIATADLDADGYPEYFITSMADNKLRALEAPGPDVAPRYADRAYKLGVTAHRPVLGGETKPSTAWHAQFGDLNNDGLEDLFVTKGNVDEMPEAAMRDHNNVLIRGADGRFTDVTQISGAVSFRRGRGAAVVDLNLDGMLDLVVVNRRAEAELWRNLGVGTADAPAPMGRWLQAALQQHEGNRNAIGAWIELRTGDRVQRREVTVGGGHA